MLARNRRPSRGHFLAAAGAFALPCALPGPVRAADSYTFRLGCSEAANSAVGLSCIRLATSIERRTKGQFKIEVYPSAQLAKEADAAQALSNGVIDLSLQSTAFLASQFIRLQLFDLPFLFKDSTVAFRTLDGPIGDEFFADMAPKGIVGLGYGGVFKEWETTSKRIVAPEDLKGLRMRAQSSPIPTATYQTLGAIPIPIDFTETLTALTQHVVDGMDVNLDGVVTGKYYSVIKHIATSNHVLSINVLLGSKRKIEALPAQLQMALHEETRVMIPYWRTLYARRIQDAVQVLKDNGVQFSEIQYPAFRKAVEPVYAIVQSKVGGDLIERISKATGVFR